MTVTRLSGQRFIGLSTDTKPTTNVPAFSTFLETNTLKTFNWDGQNWHPAYSIESDSFYDNFEAGTFNFTDGGTSPNGLWKNKFLAGGTSGVRTVSGNNVQYQHSQTATSAGQTFSVVNYTVNNTFQDFELNCRMRTITQTRTGSAPNSWEAAWLIWRIGDINGQMGYYFVIKTNGCEFGKSDNIDASASNYILATPGTPTLTLAQWYKIRVRVVGAKHQVWVDDALVINYEDISPRDAPLPSVMIQRAGHIATYNEDAQVEFDSFRVTPVYPTSVIDYDQQTNSTTPLPASNRKSGAYYGTTGGASPTGDNLFSGILTRVGSSDAAVIDDLGIHRSFTTGTTSGNQAGISTNIATFRRSHNLVLRARIKTPSTTATNHIWIGFSSSSTIGNNDDPLNTFHGMLVGYRSGSSVWGVLGNNAQATDTVQAENLSLAANDWVNVYLELQSTGKCIVRLNNRTPLVITTTTQKPGPSTSMYMHCICTTTTTAARTMTIDHIQVEMSPGNDVIV
jgi:3-keto-disaccharide hydrolase